ncbi:hypothetical protein BDF20DRAFT_822811 [Mycotypha africana]|uniref:uncharacterized protein n=1 Tax=Mycotypha africana TaxID=64632 RepID=UPI0022FFD05F|nr:uncharacterized protein BDF20DRAFT_822811 [Mycotypha africana]KAI8975573.1 hypothetical protein BDF20DRAFT_822811 [Mycotypha africana]
MATNESMDSLPPSAKLAMLHAQAANNATVTEPTPATSSPAVQVEEDTFVPSPDDPIVMDNSTFEPLIAGDFPAPIGKPVSTPKKELKPKKKEKLDLNSESAFPSLSAVPRTSIATGGGWSSAASSRVKSPQVGNSPSPNRRSMAPPAAGSNKKSSSATQITDVLELPANQQIANMPNKPLGFKSSADVIQQVINRTGTNIIASTNRSGTTTFLIQGAPAEVSKAKRELVAGLVVKRTVEITVPASTKRFIIGARGATLKQIEAKSSTRINFPRKEDEDFNIDENPDEPVTVTIMGDATGIKMAKEEIQKIVGEKAAKQTIKVDNLDSKFYLFLAGPDNNNIRKIEEECNVKINIPAIIVEGNTNCDTVISIYGDKEKANAAKQALEKNYLEIEKNSRTVAISIPKRQHKYLYGKNGENLKEIFAESGCTVELPTSDDPSENVIIRGLDADLVKGLTVVMEKARAVHVSVLDLAENYKSTGSDALQNARNALKYLITKKSIKKIEDEHNVQVGIPRSDELEKAVNLEFVSKVEKDAALAQLAVSNIVRNLTPDVFSHVDIKQYLHHYICTSHRAALERIQSTNSVITIIPEEEEQTDKLLIVYDGEDKSAAKASLEAAAAELNQVVADSSDYISKTTSIPSKFHESLRGPRYTTLNAIIGDSDVVVRFGPGDKVEVRGLTKQVNHVMTELQKAFNIVQEEDYSKPYSTEFFIPSNFSAHIIGKSGMHINKIKDKLGVKIDIGENNNNDKSEEKPSGKKDKKGAASSVKVVIQGPKINAESAKDHIMAQVRNLADQATLTLKVPKEFHRLLIGPSGRYVRKLEEKYNVHIRFPRSNRGDESPSSSPAPTNPNEITVRGGKKDAQAAKEELMELYEYEKEEQEKRKEREQKHKEYEEKRAAEEKRRAEERAAREAREAAKEAAREAKKAEKEAAAAKNE